MDDWVKVVVGGIVAIVLAALGGGAVGRGMLAIAKSLVAAIIEQNQKLTVAIEANTKETATLASAIRHDTEMQKQFNREHEKQMDRLEKFAQAASDNSAALVEKLKGRL